MKNTEGYWRIRQRPRYIDQKSLPWPVENSISAEESKKLLKILTKTEEKANLVHYKGWSDCRICGLDVGSIEFEYKNWRWPVGLSHYIEEHFVKPSNEFIKFITDEDSK